MLEACLVSGAVVEGFDVVEQDRSELGSGDVAPVAVKVSDLAFECGPGRFHGGVVEAIAGRSERWSEVPVGEPVGELD